MIILGLHFGHDASITVLRDGEVLLCYERERTNRVKHAMGLTSEDISLCLEDCGLTPDQIDYASITSTQLVECVMMDREKLSLKLEIMPEHKWACTMVDQLKVGPESMSKMRSGWLKTVSQKMKAHPYHRLFPDMERYVENEENLFGSYENFVQFPLWEKIRKLDHMALTDYRPLIENQDCSNGFHYPASVTVQGRKIPAYVFSHHYAHIAYAFYSSAYEEAALISQDGGGGGYGYGSGFFGYAKGNQIFPLTPNYLNAGEIYDAVGVRVGFDESGAAGKLMGLSAYGKPRFFNSKFVGNWFDQGTPTTEEWLEHCEKTAREMGYDMAPLGNKEKILEPINVDYAASTQKLVEEIMLKSAETLHSMLLKAVGPVKNLCLSGGLALNCPANTRLWNESAFENLHVPPAVSDMGLSIGSAYALYYNVMGNSRKNLERHTPELAYLGLRSSAAKEKVDSALAQYKSKVRIEKVADGAVAAAKDLATNKVIAWFEGRSEIGPRALGHRSILANPTFKENWARVNRIKGRELWRPFAPAVLDEKTDSLFGETQCPSYFMLLNAMVHSKEIPAVTHADRSARIQSVTADCGKFYSMLKEFDKLTGMPVVMNTSFNGPGAPIVELPAQAIDFLLSTDLDALYIGDYRIERHQV